MAIVEDRMLNQMAILQLIYLSAVDKGLPKYFNPRYLRPR